VGLVEDLKINNYFGLKSCHEFCDLCM